MISQVDTGRCTSEQAEPQRGRHRWYSSKDAGLEGVNWVVPHRLEKGMSVSKDAEPRMRVDCEIPCRLEKRTNHSL